eukprot:superscaffoldBa00007421_g22514
MRGVSTQRQRDVNRGHAHAAPSGISHCSSVAGFACSLLICSVGGVAMETVNFKEPEAVRALTCTLLKEDFGLTIEIPLERLIPTVPLRLNYIHWVEDLIDGQKQPRRGIDIGTGASCIYPLLGATMNGWYFLATEVDDICFDYATKNVEQNNLSDLIKVVKVPQKTLLMDALKEETEIVYDFCMCNPPFFANQLEAKGVNSRNSRRPPPSSVNTGGVTEIMAEGGELEFVKRIIHDSLQLKKRLRGEKARTNPVFVYRFGVQAEPTGADCHSQKHAGTPEPPGVHGNTASLVL